MELKFNVAGRIARPVEEVFKAVVNPATLSRYFATGGAEGRIETGATVYWEFQDSPGRFPVQVVEVVANERIVLRWDAHETLPAEGDGAAAPYQTTVTMTFQSLGDGRTLLSISETGWRENAEALKASYGNCHGWTQMLCALKGYLEYGINLREGMYD